MKKAIQKIIERRDGERATEKACDEKGVGILHAGTVAKQNADTLDWVLSLNWPYNEAQE